MMPFIHFHRPSIGDEEINEVVDTLKSGWLSTGPKVYKFEHDFAEEVGAFHAIAVNSCTAALHLSLEAIGVKEGDYVITTPFTFAATAEVIRYFNANVLFVDIDEDTGNIDPDMIEMAIMKHQKPDRIKAIIPVHFAGRPCDMNRIMRIGEKYNIRIIEDAAHAFPSIYSGRPIGTIGDLTAFSFYATKTITTGEGGMVTTNDDEWAERIRRMRLHGVDRDIWNRYTTNVPKWFYGVDDIGFKYNMPDIAAAIGLAQLKKAAKFRIKRKSIAIRYTQGLKDLPLILPNDANLPKFSLHSWHLYVIRLTGRIHRNRFIERMAEEGVGTSVHFIPLYEQPYWYKKLGLTFRDFPMCHKWYQSCVSLPIWPDMTDEQVSYVIEKTKKILGGENESRNI